MRWAILRELYYPIQTQNRYIVACCLIHHLIIQYDDEDDPIVAEFDEVNQENPQENNILILLMEP